MIMVKINQILLESSEKLKGHIEYEIFQHNIMGAIFFKYLSEKIEKENNKKLFKFNINYKEAFEEENIDFYAKTIKKESLENLGYFIKPDYLYQNIISEEGILKKLDDAIKHIEFQKESLNDIFYNVNFENIHINDEIKNIFESILKNINNLEFKNKTYDELNYLMEFFLKKSYTPNEISILLSKLVTIEKNTIENVYDATCGSCSTLMILKEEVNVNNYFGQEINRNNFNLARMNLIMHGINPNNFEIYNEDSTTTRRDLPPIDVVISHPPFLKKWEADEELLKDERFNTYKKLPPKSKADYAFIETMIYPLNDEGIMAVIMSQGVLFRSNAEKDIRKTFLKEKNYIDAIIGLPEKTFNKNIPTCIIILKKNRNKNDGILFIDASNEYDNSSHLNKLRKEDIYKIVETYKNKEEIEKYSHFADINEIKKNDFNLNIKRYVNTYEEKEKINIQETIKEINDIEIKIKEIKLEQKELLKKIDINLS